jgi:hypothetical protein
LSAKAASGTGGPFADACPVYGGFSAWDEGSLLVFA